MKKTSLIILQVTLSLFVRAQTGPDELFFKDRLQPVSEENIFKTEGYFIWGAPLSKEKMGCTICFTPGGKKNIPSLAGRPIPRLHMR